jgi:hypothetical protein
LRLSLRGITKQIESVDCDLFGQTDFIFATPLWKSTKFYPTKLPDLAGKQELAKPKPVARDQGLSNIFCVFILVFLLVVLRNLGFG